MRSAGVLLPIFSLPSKYGIGCLSKEAYKFADFVSDSGLKYWQVLPLGPTGYGDSPYQSFSTFAGNPYFIDVEKLMENGMLTKNECSRYSAADGEYINYEKLYVNRMKLLRIAYSRSKIDTNEDFIRFLGENKNWLDDYALFMAVKNKFNGIAWYEWPENIRTRKPKAIKAYETECCDEVNFYKFLQFCFFSQWREFKNYVNQKGVKLIGDIPIYVAYDSADVWAGHKLFDLNTEYEPNAVAGCPPDPFAVTGQLWGNPLYDWDYHKKTGYKWWLGRIKSAFELCDALRIDHFRGFDEFYAIPFKDKTAEFGVWRKGPGRELFDKVKEKLGNKEIIAEDLGFLTSGVRKLVKETGFPGMKVLLFAFDSTNRCEYLPHMDEENTVIYTGTHDNETVRGWYERITKEDKKTKKYFDLYTQNQSNDTAAGNAIRLAMGSVSKTCIIPMQDFLNLNNDGRINTPSTLGFNWNWRMKKGAYNKSLSKEIKELVYTFGRD